MSYSSDMKIIVGSMSKLKNDCVKSVLSQYIKGPFEINAVATESGVPETPYGKQIMKGAYNRAMYCKDTYTSDYYIGIEGGLVRRYGILYEETWACIVTKNEKKYLGYSSGLSVPKSILATMKQNELSYAKVVKTIENERNMKASDTWSVCSNGILTRTLSLEEAIRNALIQIL